MQVVLAYNKLNLAAQCIVIGLVCGGRCLWVCYHDNSKLRASILTKLGLGKGSDPLQLIKFWPSFAPGRGSATGRKFLAPPYYSQRAVFASLRALFHFLFTSEAW